MKQVLRQVRKKLAFSPGSIGQLEAIAGLEPDEKSRRKFWVDCDREAKSRFNVTFASGEQVFHVGRERCYALIAKRIRLGVLSLR